MRFNIILIDPNVLNQLFIHHTLFDELNEHFVTFAVFNQSVQSLLQTLQQMPHFSIQTSASTLTNHRMSVDHIFITYQYKTLHLAVLHKYYSFYLVQPNHFRFSDDENVHLSFGDKLRAVDQ